MLRRWGSCSTASRDRMRFPLEAPSQPGFLSECHRHSLRIPFSPHTTQHKNKKRSGWITFCFYAQEVGFEPTTNRLTVDCSTAELLLNSVHLKELSIKHEGQYNDELQQRQGSRLFSLYKHFPRLTIDKMPKIR